jgi:Holliday junction resolvase RusA-like endonuclease
MGRHRPRSQVTRILGTGVRVPPDPRPPAYVERLLLTVPLGPSVNHLYFNAKRRRVKSEAARDYEDAVGKRVAIARQQAGGVPRPPYILCFGVWFPDQSQRDLDNLLKCLQDAIVRAIRSDDQHVHFLGIRRQGVDPGNPRIDVELRSVGCTLSTTVTSVVWETI